MRTCPTLLCSGALRGVELISWLQVELSTDCCTTPQPLEHTALKFIFTCIVLWHLCCRQVCRQFLRGACNRMEEECRFAHPPNNVRVTSDNMVTACIDFIKGRCGRSACHYFHPPDHLKARVYIKTGGVRTAERWWFPWPETSGKCCRRSLLLTSDSYLINITAKAVQSNGYVLFID